MLKDSKKVSVNIFFSIVVQLATFLTPLITSPYISRVFTAELIGTYSYVLANSSYFVLIELLGLPLYGTIKGAGIRDDKEKLSKIFWEIMLLKMLLMLICSIIYIYLFVINGNSLYSKIYIIVICNLIANGIDITWFLNAIEEFKIIAIRGIFVRAVQVVAILLLVKTENDFYIYVIIMQVAALFSYITLLPSLKGKIVTVKINNINIFQHLKPSMVYFVPGLVNTIYSAADKTVLGLIGADTYENGVYEQANKICQLFISIISAISNVFLPRIAYLYHNGDNKDANKFLNTTLRVAFCLTLPMVGGIILISDAFVPIFFGAGYEKSSVLLKILSFNVLFVTLSNFCGQQCLIARNRQAQYNIAVCIGSVINVLLNLLLVNKYQSVGVSIASVLASMLNFFFILYQSREVITFRNILKISYKYLIATMVMYIIVVMLSLNDVSLWGLIRKIVFAVFCYGIALIIQKDSIMFNLLVSARKRLKRSCNKGDK